jgi:hypothetical protein
MNYSNMHLVEERVMSISQNVKYHRVAALRKLLPLICDAEFTTFINKIPCGGNETIGCHAYSPSSR